MLDFISRGGNANENQTIMRYHYTPTREAQIKSTDSTKCWQEYGATGTHIMVGCKLVYHSENYLAMSTKLNIYLPRCISKRIGYMFQMLIVALFVMAKSRNYPKHP